ncbi:MAG: SPOR domain-containing protein, partial [Kamptonema sp. SIO4C4]|nr:SPOR domain-containing protein [Kamptonema sp. SIO4C4]
MTPPEPAPLPTGGPADQPAAPARFDDDGALPPGSDTVPPEPAAASPAVSGSAPPRAPAPPGGSGRPDANADPASRAGDVPEHVRLAYRPDGAVALTDLPEDFYAVQLLAMSSKEALESFVAREQISGMSAARVERNGELYFVLLLGIYENADIAREAVASL